MNFHLTNNTKWNCHVKYGIVFIFFKSCCFNLRHQGRFEMLRQFQPGLRTTFMYVWRPEHR